METQHIRLYAILLFPAPRDLMSKQFPLICIVIACLLAAGCQLGPKTLEHSRIHYNHAVQTTASEEMLLNLVRMKYRDPVEFVRIPSITGQHTYSGDLGFVIPFNGGGLSAIDLGAEEKPTIVYQPEQGAEFSSRILSRIGTETLDLLASKGWAADRTMRLIIRNMNDVDNATSAGGPTPYLKPRFEEFRHATYLIRKLQKRRQVELAYEVVTTDPAVQVSDPINEMRVDSAALLDAAERGYRFRPVNRWQVALFSVEKSGPVMVFRVAPEARHSPEMLTIAAIFELEPGLEYYRFELNTLGQLKKPSTARGSHGVPLGSPLHGGEIIAAPLSCEVCTRLPATGLREEMSVSTRSIMEIMYYLSHGTDVPFCHIEQGLVTQTYDEFGHPFDWRAMTHDLLQIHVSDTHPCDAAAVAVHYRGHYFYIADNDQNSKSTFNLLIELFNLKVRAGGGAQIPLLTI